MYLFKDFILGINYGPTNERASERVRALHLAFRLPLAFTYFLAEPER